ncbi:MAG: S9 family peptidase [Alphaproteobacteria bacterium]|nr:S9 family peptidase [Alphaproteobacteria bacterium]
MTSVRLRAAHLAAASFAALLAASAAQAAPPVEAFGNLPAIQSVHLNADGTYFSALEPVNGRNAVLVFQLHPPPGAKPQVYALKDADANGSMWVNNDRIIGSFYQNKFNDESTGMNLRKFERIVSASISQKTQPFFLMEGTRVYSQNGGQGFGIVGLNVDKPDIVYVQGFRYYDSGDADTRLGNGRARLEIFAVNAVNNSIDQVDTGDRFTVGYRLDEHGNLVGRHDATDESELPKNTDTFLVRDGGWREAATFDNTRGSYAALENLSMDGSGLVVWKYGSHDKNYLETLPIKAGAQPSVIYQNPDYDVSDVIQDDWTGRVVGARYVDDKIETVFFDPVLAHIQKRMEAALPGQSVTLASWNRKRDTFLVSAQDPHDPPGIYLFTTADSHLEYLMNGWPGLQPSDLADVKTYPYKARDGLDIHAYLTLPNGKSPHNLPTVILPHGGPDGRDFIGFDYWAQFFASRGYAVLQPNFRGSIGYGVAFRNAGYGQWGRKMQDDITDGVKKLIADGIADPKKVCIVGGSYGGYAALAGATFTPDLYACAVSYAGIADVRSILGMARGAGADSSAMHFWEDRVGVSYADSAALEAISPAFHAQNVRAPVLLLHSNMDTVVPIQQSERELNALQAAGKQVRFVRLEGSDHTLDHADARTTVLREIESFLAAHIGN